MGGCPVQRISVVSGLACVRIRAVLEQQPYGVHLPALGRRVESRPAPVLCRGVSNANQAWVVREQSAQQVDVALDTGLKEQGNVLCVPLLDLGLQGTPVGEAVIARDSQ